MSSDCVGSNSLSEGKKLVEDCKLNSLPIKLTTEFTDIPSLSEDVFLNSPENPGELRPGEAAISDCSVLSDNLHNGSLKNSDCSEDPETCKDFIEAFPGDEAVVANQDSSLNVVSKETCRFYERNGYCRFGKRCRYSHSISNESKYVSSNSDLKQRSDNTDGAKTDTDNAEKATEENTSNLGENRQVCRFFWRKGYCRYGESCKFVHQISRPKPDFTADGKYIPTEATLTEIPGECNSDQRTKVSESFASKHSPDIAKSGRMCRLYSRYGKCHFGNSCKYRHVERKKVNDNKAIKVPGEIVESASQETVINQETDETPSTANCDDSTKEQIKPKPVLLRNKKLSEMTPEDFLKLRNTEISVVKRKFSKCGITVLPDVGHVFEIEFSPSDPDWRFEVKSITMTVMIPERYPEDNLQVDLLNPEGVLPEKLVRYFNNSTFMWLQSSQEKNRINDEVHLIFRPFLKWLDKSLEDIFISGLKMVKRDIEARAAGIEFVTHEELNAINKSKEANCKQPNAEESTPAEDLALTSTLEYEEEMPDFSGSVGSQAVLMDQSIDRRSVVETARRGTEVKLRNLEFHEGAVSLTCCKLSITVQCGRCTMRSDLTVSPHHSHCIICERCRHQQRVTFRSQMLHQFTTVAGYLDLENCQVIDLPLLNCEFALQCLPCGRQNFLSGVQYGQRHTTWCLFCHSKMSISIESFKLNQLQPNTEAVVAKAGQTLKLEKKEKKVKDPIIQEGKPLPENGTCKHYKKSFRWLRFPCCGKAYPCDHCHDEKETDHEMKFAARMICGFCAKEQPYTTDRPCISCALNVTKKSGPHWEGGKGCRDKVKMSKDDRQKYAGCNKTVSRKIQPAPKKEK